MPLKQSRNHSYFRSFVVALSATLPMLGCRADTNEERVSAILSVRRPHPTRLAGRFSEVDYERLKADITQLMRSRPILSDAIMLSEVSALAIVKERQDPISWLQGAIEIKWLNSSDYFEVALTGSDREQNRTIVDAVVSAYLSFQDRQGNSFLLQRHLAQLQQLYENQKRSFEKVARECRALSKMLPEREG